VPGSVGVICVRQQTSIKNTALLNIITYYNSTGFHPLNLPQGFYTHIYHYPLLFMWILCAIYRVVVSIRTAMFTTKIYAFGLHSLVVFSLYSLNNPLFFPCTSFADGTSSC